MRNVIKLMTYSQTKMSISLSGNLSVILPLVLPLVSFSLDVITYVAATNPNHGAVFTIAVLHIFVSVPCSCAIAFCRSDKSAVIVFSLAVISLLLLSCLIQMPGFLTRSD